jgi:hypothetical protein
LTSTLRRDPLNVLTPTFKRRDKKRNLFTPSSKVNSSPQVSLFSSIPFFREQDENYFHIIDARSDSESEDEPDIETSSGERPCFDISKSYNWKSCISSPPISSQSGSGPVPDQVQDKSGEPPSSPFEPKAPPMREPLISTPFPMSSGTSIFISQESHGSRSDELNAISVVNHQGATIVAKDTGEPPGPSTIGFPHMTYPMTSEPVAKQKGISSLLFATYLSFQIPIGTSRPIPDVQNSSLREPTRINRKEVLFKSLIRKAALNKGFVEATQSVRER